jgi:hypothetical protein
MPKIKSTPISGTAIRSKHGVTISISMSNENIRPESPSSSNSEADNSLSVRILSVTSEAKAIRSLYHARQSLRNSRSPPAKSRRARNRETSMPLSSNNGSVSGMEDGDTKTHRHWVQDPSMWNLNAEPGTCMICATRKTGQWRRGPEGPRTLCNVSSRAGFIV